MSSVRVRGVNFAAALLPGSVRERYREQWLGELRDASEVGVSESDISRGAIVFAAAVTRDIPGWSKVSTQTTSKRLRWAAALSVSAAVLTLSQYLIPDNAFWLPRVSETSDPVLFAAQTGLLLLAPIAALVALVMVVATTGAPARVRTSVGLLTASTVGVSYLGSSEYSPHAWWIPTFESARPFIFLVGAVLFVVAIVVSAAGRRVATEALPQALSRRLLASVSGGIIVLAAVIITHANSVVVWASHPVMTYNHVVTDVNRADYTAWALGWKTGEQYAATVLGVFLISGIIVACLIAALGVVRRATVRLTVVISVLAVFGVLLASGLVNSVLQFTRVAVSPLIPTQWAWMLALLGIAVTILIAVGRAGSRGDTAR